MHRTSAEALALTSQIEDFRRELLVRLTAIERKLDASGTVSPVSPLSRTPCVGIPGVGIPGEVSLTPRKSVLANVECESLPEGGLADATRSEPPRTRAGWTDDRAVDQADQRPVGHEDTRVKKQSVATLDSALVRRSQVKWNASDRVMEERTCSEWLLTKLGWTRVLHMVRSATENPQSLSGWQWVHGPKFTGACSFMIVLHALFIGYSASAVLQAEMQGRPHPSGLSFVETMFATFFMVELALRFAVERWLFFCGPEFKWNMFDSLLVLSSVVELISLLAGAEIPSNIAIGRVFRVLRFFRLARISRVIRHFSSLRFVLFAILDSLSSLFWCLVLIALTLYVFAVMLLNVASEHFQRAGPSMEDTLSQDLRFWYGSLYKSMLSLFMTISGGADWGEPMLPLVEVHWLYGPIFVCFILVMHFGVLNVVIGTFVATATEIASRDREAAVKCEIRQCELYRSRIKTFFQEADLDKSGTLSWEEFKAHLNNREVKAYFQTLDLDISQAHMLFELLDIDGSNSVTIDEFLEGCMRLKGKARSIDVNMLLRLNRKLYEHVSRSIQFLDKRYERIEARVGAIARITAAGMSVSRDVLA